MPPRVEYRLDPKIGDFIADDDNGPSIIVPQHGMTYAENFEFAYGKEGNFLWNRIGYLPPEMDVGHAMGLRGAKTDCGLLNVGQIHSGAGLGNLRYKGAFVVDPGFQHIPGNIPTAENYMVEAYKKMKPTKPVGGIANTLAELRELPGMIRGKLLSGLPGLGARWKDISNIHLAYQFGWKPLLQEIAQMIEIQINAQKYLQQLLRDENRPIRRRIVVYDNFPDPQVSNHTSYGALRPVLTTQFYAYEPKVRRVYRSRDRIWASAQFRYWLPKGPRNIEYADRLLRRIKGGGISPSVLYNAVPWSWLIDWFFNFGDVLENMEAGVADRLVADRFYGMRTVQIESRDFVTAGFYRKNGEVVNFHGSAVCSAHTKSRIKGDPFGFGTKQSDLSLLQLSILGALGISKLG